MAAKVVGAATEDDMVATLLRAELDSPTEADRLARALAEGGATPALIRSADTTNEDENRLRREVMDIYRGRERVFADLPNDLAWIWAELTESEVRDRAFTCSYHFEERYGTRRVAEIAALLNELRPAVPNDVVDRLRAGHTPEPPILVAEPRMDRFVVLEGHNRLISYLREPSAVSFPLQVLVGLSDGISEWSEW